MMAKPETLFARRAVLAGLLALPAMGLAHEGHGPARVKASGKVRRVSGQEVEIRLELLNLGSNEVVVFGLAGKGFAATPFPAPIVISAFGVAEVSAKLIFEGAVPGVFTAYLDFGVHGSGMVVLTP